jgi:hypothetical protein
MTLFVRYKRPLCFLIMSIIILVGSFFLHLSANPDFYLSNLPVEPIKDSIFVNFTYENPSQSKFNLKLKNAEGKVALVEYYDSNQNNAIKFDGNEKLYKVKNNILTVEFSPKMEKENDTYILKVNLMPWRCSKSANLYASSYCQKRIQDFTVLRQTRRYLAKLGIDNTYTIYESTNLDLETILSSSEEASSLYPQRYDKELNLLRDQRIDVENNIDYPEIIDSIKIVKYMYKNAIHMGGNSDNSISGNDFLMLSPLERLNLVWSNKFRVSCAGFRDIWIDIAKTLPSLSGKVRHVSAYQLDPGRSKELIFYSHALSEVYVSALKQWVLFDPWFGIVVTSGNKLISAEEFQIGFNSESLKFINICEQKFSKYAVVDADEDISETVSTAMSKMNASSYSRYFGTVKYGPTLYGVDNFS